KDPALAGLLPASISAEHLGPFDYFYWDDFWSLKGLIDGATLLHALGDDDGATRAMQWAAQLRAAIDTSIHHTAVRLATDPIPGSTAGAWATAITVGRRPTSCRSCAPLS